MDAPDGGACQCTPVGTGGRIILAYSKEHQVFLPSYYGGLSPAREKRQRGRMIEKVVASGGISASFPGLLPGKGLQAQPEWCR
jgi:hypothetical protein